MWNCPIVISLSPAWMAPMSPDLFPHTLFMSLRLPLFLTLPLHYVGGLVGLMFSFITLTQWTGFIFGPGVFSKAHLLLSHPQSCSLVISFPHYLYIIRYRQFPVFPRVKGSIFQQCDSWSVPLLILLRPGTPGSNEGLVNLPHNQCSLLSPACAEELEDKSNLILTSV